MTERLLRVLLSDTFLLLLGATLINLALIHGLGIDFGWWGFAFWAGVGLIFAAVKE